ncbi:MAG: B-box zinc finger protein [Candidatus Bathyarchaeota archaeon]|nr:B-box zinc finger protein [Candidatus Bathyarchaeota archaeon]
MSEFKCEICNLRDARYVCQYCGKRVCSYCKISDRFMCAECWRTREGYVESQFKVEGTRLLPSKLMFVGFITMVLGFILIFISAFLGNLAGEGWSGGVFWIFPLPPVFVGSSLAGVSIILTFLTFIIFLVIVIFLITKTLRY